MFHTLKRHCFNAEKVRISSQSNFSSEQMFNFVKQMCSSKKRTLKYFFLFILSNVRMSVYQNI